MRPRYRTISTSRLIATFACAASLALFAPGIAIAAGASGTTFIVSGAGRGTLRAGRSSGCLDSNVATNGLIVVDRLLGRISHFSSDGGNWSLDVTERKVGSFNFNGSYTAEPTAELFAVPNDKMYSKVTADQFFARRGSITVGSGNGSINASFMNMAGKRIIVVGSWHCKA